MLYIFLSLFTIVNAVAILDDFIASIISRIMSVFGVTVIFNDTTIIAAPLFLFFCWLSYRMRMSRTRAKEERIKLYQSLVQQLLERFEDPELPSCESMILCEVGMRLSGKRPRKLFKPTSEDPKCAAVDLLHQICVDKLASDWGRYTSGALTDFGLQLQHICGRCSPQKTVYLTETDAGQIVRVPDSKLSAWQESQKNSNDELTPAEKEVVSLMLDHLYMDAQDTTKDK